MIGRYEVRRRIGGGGMGDVFHVFDPVRRRDLALKTLKATYPRALHYFKREFRAVSRLSHPNLVQLHDLHHVDGLYFITMELIDGQDLYAWVNGTDRVVTDPRRLLDPDRVVRLRHALVQLLRGLAYLHDNRRVHRDIKPSNIMVDRGGRVVLLDFGIVKELDPSNPGESLSQVFGTSTYMSPEQSLGSRVKFATDLYAIGVVLYELLSGEPPFDGEGPDVLHQHRTAPPPSLVNRLPGIPPDLALLAMSLLSKEPADRPGAHEAIEMLGQRAATELISEGQEFVGRREERKALASALDAVQAGQGRMVIVEGRSGTGKSALLRAFADESKIYTAATFKGTCVARDHSAARGLDTLIDRLAEAYRRQTAAILRHLPADERGALLRAFPFLSELLPETLQGDRPRGHGWHNLAGHGLKTLLCELGTRRLLVLVVEHLHHADDLTVRLLEALYLGGNLPPVMIVVTVRDDAPPALARLPSFLDLMSGHPAVSRLRLGPLSGSETARLLALKLGDRPGVDPDRLYRETGGDPLQLVELIAFLERRRPEEMPRMEHLVAERVRALPEGAQQVLAALCLSRFPVPASVMEQACRLDGDGLNAAIDALEKERLALSWSKSDGDMMIAPRHARWIEIARAAMKPDAQQALHEALAKAYEGEGGPADAVAHHWEGAGDRSRAPRFAFRAAAEARSAGRHDRAAEMLSLALSGPPPDVDPDALRMNLVDSLVRAGRYEEAATALEALIHGDPVNADRWLARQGELYLMAGNLAAFAERVQHLPPGASTVRLADLFVPLDPLAAERLLGDVDTPVAQLVRARLLAGQNHPDGITAAVRMVRSVESVASKGGPAMAAAFDIADTVVLRALGDYRGAERAVARAVQRFQGRVPRHELAGLRVELARVQLAQDQGRIGQAKELGRALVERTRERALPGVLARACMLLGVAHLECGEPHAADRLLDEAASHWPPTPPAQPLAQLALARARRRLYVGAPDEAVEAIETLLGNRSLRRYMDRRELARGATILLARAHAVRAILGWRAKDMLATVEARERLQTYLELLHQTYPYPSGVATVMSAIDLLTGEQPSKAIRRVSPLVEQPDNPLVSALAAHVVSVARELLAPGEGRRAAKRAAMLLRDAGAAPAPEAVALGAAEPPAHT